jgi:hypothetical protein
MFETLATATSFAQPGLPSLDWDFTTFLIFIGSRLLFSGFRHFDYGSVKRDKILLMNYVNYLGLIQVLIG